ncbi:MAG: MarR family transcriptional regulator [Firmicutes bacterium]|nr:MarR family transcriptional regulator [Bacillota bacterium]
MTLFVRTCRIIGITEPGSFAVMTESDDVVWEIESLLRAVSSSVRKNGRAILVDFDITPPQFDALVVISLTDKLAIGDLSGRLGLAYSTTTDLVDRLERRGFVLRVRDEEDKRVVRVRMLPAGEELIDRLMTARRAYLARVLEQVGAPEQEALLRALTVLAKHLVVS